MEYIVDVQGFKISLNEFVYKEVAIIPLEEDGIPSVFLFKPPYHWDQLLDKNKSENQWLERNYHGILWKSGTVPYKEVSNTIRTIVQNSQVYVKGYEKSEWLKRILADKSVKNIEELGCPSLKSLCDDATNDDNVSCTNHTENKNPVCALHNAMAMKKWLIQQIC